MNVAWLSDTLKKQQTWHLALNIKHVCVCGASNEKFKYNRDSEKWEREWAREIVYECKIQNWIIKKIYAWLCGKRWW